MKRLIDVHVHLAAVPTEENGCYLSPRMRKSLLFRMLAWKLGLNVHDPKSANATYIARLLKDLSLSTRVDKAVLLAIDGVYDEKGELDWQRTEFLISNRYLLEVAKKHPEYFLAGVSINPKRKDAIDELARCAEEGAVLVKILPNTQCFDPSDKHFVPFYRALANYNIPLLSHVGCEFSLSGRNQLAGNPKKLQMALDEAVTVIAAHACSLGLVFPEPYFHWMIELVHRYTNFYADASALTLPNRARTLFLLRRHPEVHERLLFGTDYPLPVFSYPALGHGWSQSKKTATPFDRQASVLENLGIRFNDFAHLREKIKG